MRILQVNKFLYPKGGAESYLFGLSQALVAAGHEVAFFGMDHPGNPDLPYRKYWVKNVDFKQAKGLDKLKAAPRLIWNQEAKRNFRHLIAEFKPDIIHCHNIYHQLSPSILPEAKKAGIPVVMHLHDYKLISADYLMFHDGKPCERCAGASLWHCVRHRCYGSYSASGLVALETWLNRDILDVYRRNVDRYISPSRFVERMFVQAGYPADRIKQVPNFIVPAEFVPENEEKDYLLYFGRLSREKGIDVLIKALAGTNHTLKIAGAGPEEGKLRDLARSLGLAGQVEFTGFQDQAQLNHLIREAKAVIFPSIWFENAPLSLLESLARGKICLASNIGGMPEVIEHGDNGLLFKPGDPQSIREAIDSLPTIHRDWMKKAAYEKSKGYAIGKIIPRILEIYEELIGQGK